MVQKIWSKGIFVGNPVIYDETAPPIKTYCRECGHETGEERPHAQECRCVRCEFNRQVDRNAFSLLSAPDKSISFRRMEMTR